MTATRPYRGASADQRRARRRAALLEAGLELLGTQGWAGTTVRGVCAQAGLNDRYFYESFPDLDTLLVAVFDDLTERGQAAILAATNAVAPELRLRVDAAVSATVDFLTVDPRHTQVLVYEIQASPVLRNRRRVLVRALVDIFTGQFHELIGDVTLSETEVEMTALSMVGGAWELVATWLRGDLAVDRERLIDFIVSLMLTATPQNGRNPSPRG